MFSALAYGCVYQFYYQYGDSMNYYSAGKEYFYYLLEKPTAIIDFIFLDQDLLNEKYKDLIDHSAHIYDYFIDSNILVHKFVLFLGFFSGYLFFPICVLFSLISYIGCWKMYRSISKLYPQYEQYFKISFLYLPSVVFWTSGIGKDAICLGFINLFASFIIESWIYKKHIFRNMVWCAFFLYVSFIIKSYIVLSFAPLYLIFIFLLKIKSIQNHGKKILIGALFFLILLGGGLFLLFNSSIVEKVSAEIVSGALFLTTGQQNTAAGNESKYDLGFTYDDIKAKNVKPYIIPAIEVALFRPYLWEVNKPIIVFSFLESCFFLFFTLYVIVKGRILNTIKIILNNNFVMFCLLYSLIFAFFVGLVSANFGTLIRYKTPFISYFLIALFIIRDTLISKKDLKLSDRKAD